SATMIKPDKTRFFEDHYFIQKCTRDHPSSLPRLPTIEIHIISLDLDGHGYETNQAFSISTADDEGFQKITLDLNSGRAVFHEQHLYICAQYKIQPRKRYSSFDTLRAMTNSLIKTRFLRVLGKNQISSPGTPDDDGRFSMLYIKDPRRFYTLQALINSLIKTRFLKRCVKKIRLVTFPRTYKNVLLIIAVMDTKCIGFHEQNRLHFVPKIQLVKGSFVHLDIKHTSIKIPRVYTLRALINSLIKQDFLKSIGEKISSYNASLTNSPSVNNFEVIAICFYSVTSTNQVFSIAPDDDGRLQHIKRYSSFDIYETDQLPDKNKISLKI
ncbi:hypothetical protein L9F63_022410, partial [Diploptera punctata]